MAKSNNNIPKFVKTHIKNKQEEFIKERIHRQKAGQELYKLREEQRRVQFETLYGKNFQEYLEQMRKISQKRREIFKQLDQKTLITQKASMKSEAHTFGSYADAPKQYLLDFGPIQFLPFTCGEVDINEQPAWSIRNDPSLSWWPADEIDAEYDWDDTPPDFNWVAEPVAGEVSTAQINFDDISVYGRGGGWDSVWVWLTSVSRWKAEGQGTFRAHAYYSGGNGYAAGDDNCVGLNLLNREGYFGLSISVWVTTVNGILSEKKRTIADHYEDRPWDAMGSAPYYRHLDHHIAPPKKSIPDGEDVYIISIIKIEAQAEEGASAGFVTPTPLSIKHVITGKKCGLINS